MNAARSFLADDVPMPRPARHLYLALVAGRITKRTGHLQPIFRLLFCALVSALAFSSPAHAVLDVTEHLYTETQNTYLLRDIETGELFPPQTDPAQLANRTLTPEL